MVSGKALEAMCSRRRLLENEHPWPSDNIFSPPSETKAKLLQSSMAPIEDFLTHADTMYATHQAMYVTFTKMAKPGNFLTGERSKGMPWGKIQRPLQYAILQKGPPSSM